MVLAIILVLGAFIVITCFLNWVRAYGLVLCILSQLFACFSGDRHLFLNLQAHG